MNKMVNEGFAERVENPALTKLMKVWESKQARVAKQAGGFGLIAVSLSACGSSGSSVTPPDPDAEDGNIFNLTTGVDNPLNLESAGDSGILGDIFNAALGLGIDGLVGVQTLQEADVLVGTDEQDILNATLNGTGAGGVFAAPSITDIEVFNLTARDGLLFESGLDLFNSTGYTQLWNIGSNTDLTLDNVRENAAIGMDNVVGGTTYNVNYTSSADTSVQNVIAIAVGTSEATGQAELDIDTAAGNGFGTLNLAVSETVRLNLDDEAADMMNFNITGSGVTELSGEDEFDQLVMLDSTGYTGDLELDISGGGTLESVMTGVGADAIRVAAATFSVDTPATTVDLGAGDNRLILEDTVNTNIYSGGGVIDNLELSALDFTFAPVSNVQTLELFDVQLFNDAILNMDGISADLQTLEFTNDLANGGDVGLAGNGNELALANSPVDDLIINADQITDLDLQTGNIVNLDVNVTDEDGTLDLDQVGGSVLETLDVAQTTGEFGQLWLDIDSDASNDVSALQSITATAVGSAGVDIDADDADADMNALTTVSVIAGDDADLDMDGVPASKQEQEVSVSGFVVGSVTVELPDGQQITFDNNDSQATIDALFDGTGYTADRSVSPGDYTLNITREAFGPADPIVIVSTNVVGFAQVSTTVTELGVAPDSVSGLETVVVEGGESADVNIEDVYGLFTLDVTANGILLGDDADVDLDDTNVTEVTVTVNTAVEYNAGVTDHVDDGTGHADIDIEGSNSSDYYGNPFLTSLTVTSGTASIDLDDDLSSMTTIDLTGVVDQFDVDASGAEYAEGSNVRYLIGGTSSEITNLNGDSSIDLGDGSVASVRELVTFTEADFGTVVLNNFTAQSADPNETDRIDLSQLGFTNEGQLDFEIGEYDGNGVFTSGGDESDIRITDGNFTDGTTMSGEIIVTDLNGGAALTQVQVEDLQSNVVYL